MPTSLLSKIENMMPQFSKSQRLIAEYIKNNYDKASFMTAYQIGTEVGVSESTVVRFATELGYEGYPKLQKSMQEMIRNKLTSVQRMEVAVSRIGNDDILNKVLNKDIDRIKKTLESTSHENFYNAVNLILKAKKIYIISARSSSCLGSFLGFYFSLIFDNVKVINTLNETEIYEQLLRASSEDVVIGISFPRYSKVVVEAMKFAYKKQAKCIAMTDSISSPLATYCSNVLVARSDMISVVDSLVAPLSMVNALIAAVAIKKQDDVLNTFKNLEEIWEKYEMYEKAEED